MAFTVQDFFGPHRWQHFSFFAKGSAVASFINETVEHNGAWKLAEVRLHFSTAFGSVNYLRLNVSAINGSSYDTILLSQSLNGVQDLFVQYFEPVLMVSGDKLRIISSQISVANEYGLQVSGWAIID